MLFYWFVEALRTLVALFKLPRPEELAKRDKNCRCPVCGARNGRLRCVLQLKPGPIVRDKMPEGQILCQHRCKECGAGWHEKPIADKVTPGVVLPAVARTEIEKDEDRAGRMYQQPQQIQ